MVNYLTFSQKRKRIKVLKKLANGISILMHPMMMPTFLFAILVLFTPSVLNPLSHEGRTGILMVIFISTFLMPFLLLLVINLFTKQHFSLEYFYMHNTRERFLPFMFVGLFYLTMTYYIFSSINKVVLLIMLGISVATILVAFISYFWKISAHAVGVTGVVGYLLVVSYFFKESNLFYPVIIVIVLAGVLLSARMFLQMHTPKQILAGTFLGLIISLSTILFF